MSPPTREFRRLSLGQNTPDDREGPSSTAREAGQVDSSDDEEGNSSAAESSNEEEKGEEDNDDNDDDDGDESAEESGEDDDEESGSASTVRAKSGILYDLRHLDTEVEARALVGLAGQYHVVNCRASDSGYDFQLLDRPRVHLSSDSPTCTCSTFRDRPDVACHHIFVCFLLSAAMTPAQCSAQC